MDDSGRNDSVGDVKVFLLTDLEWSTIGILFIRDVRCLAAVRIVFKSIDSPVGIGNGYEVPLDAVFIVDEYQAVLILDRVDLTAI